MNNDVKIAVVSDDVIVIWRNKLLEIDLRSSLIRNWNLSI